ncbi:hypothetical protein Tco_0819605 [Tanacetum coccineum]|uniref:Zinc finger, CCHC-type n=1 Tax=Tanacetum coccineum TaxID=301880 RepID=A0ABQ5A7X1_9ASTR
MIDVSLGQCWRVKQLALFDHEGGLIEHYGKLYQYRQALLDLNPRSTCRLDVDESANGSATFKRIYICFKGVKDGWLAGCRKGLIDAMNDWLPEPLVYQNNSLCKSWVDESAYDYLIQRNPNSWSRAFFEMDRRCSAFENGISESFNRAILGPRHKPIITMLEEIRLYIMQRIVAMNKLAFSLEDRITPSIRKRLEILKKKQREWIVYPSGFQELEVRKGDQSYGVNLQHKQIHSRENMNNNQSAGFQAGQAKGQAEEKGSQLMDQASNAAQSAKESVQQESVNLKQEVSCLMLSSMSLDLQRTLEKYNAYDMLKELKTMFEEQTKQELFETVKAFHAYKQEDGQSVSSYLLKMKSYLDTLERLGYAMPNELGGKAKGKNNLAYASKTKIPPPPKRDNPAKDSIYHHCKEVGHWKRNFPSYHTKLKKRNNASKDSTSGIFTIELYAFPNNTWVYDTGYGTHICNTSQGLKGSRKLKHRALSLYMGNGMCATVKAIRSFDLILPSSLIIVLDNCHFVPTVTRGVVSISCLVKNGYIHAFTNYGISVSKDNVFYFNAIPCDGIYEIDMHNLYPNISSNYNVSNKRAKHGLDFYYLWHYRL